MFREWLARLGRHDAGPKYRSTMSSKGEAERAALAAGLCARAETQRLAGAYAEAEQNLLKAIEAKHDLGEAHYRLGRLYLDQGRAEDAADCLQLAVHHSPGSASAHAALGAALFAMERYEEAEAACRAAIALDTELPDVWFTLGRTLKRRGDLDGAANAFAATLERDAKNADARCQLGFAFLRLGRYDEARRVYEALLADQPDFAEAHHNFGLLLLETGYPAEALASFERTLALDRSIIETQTCIGHALRDLGRLDEAVAAYDRVLLRHSNSGDAVINRCYALLMRGDYGRGWQEYERRFVATGTARRDFGLPPWRSESLRGKRILVVAEQGVGDEIMFASCIPELLPEAGECVIECNTRLARLFTRSFSGARVHGGEKADDARWLEAEPRPHCHVAIGSLPLHFRPTASHFPARGGYLRADAGRIRHWRDALSASSLMHIGIAWRGGTPQTREALRSMEVPQLLPLLNQAGCEFINLQYGACAHELLAATPSGAAVRDLGLASEDLDELAAVISALDLVITVDNTIAHLAGALGQRVWVMLSYSPEWRYPRGGDAMPWYPSARLFRQSTPRGWEEVMDNVAAALSQQIAVCRANPAQFQ